MIAEVILMKTKLLLTAFFLAIAACVAYLAIAQNKVADAPEKRLIIKPYLYIGDETDPNKWDEKSKFAFTELLPGETRLMAPTYGAGLWNLNIGFEYEGGIIRVESDDCQISVGERAIPFYVSSTEGRGTDRIYCYKWQLRDSGYLAFRPAIGAYGFAEIDDIKIMAFEHYDGYPGLESFVTINVFNDDADKYPVYSATLKFVQLHEDSPFQDRVSRFFSIEYVDSYSAPDE